MREGLLFYDTQGPPAPSNLIRFEMPQRKLDVAIIADDLTGALDTAAPFAALGFESMVRLDLDPSPLTAGDDTRVLSLTTESRHLARDMAEERIRLAIAAAIVNQPRILLKKIDSTLRGNVAAEILACLRWCGRRHALIAPAVPSQGRVMRGGEIFIHGVPLRETQIGSGSLSPPPSVPLPEALSAASAALTVHSWPRGAVFPLSVDAGLHAYVADCETDLELDAIAQLASSHRDELLPVGASGLGAALARRLAGASASKPMFPTVNIGQGARRPFLFVIGSRNAASAEQMVQLGEAGAKELAIPLSASERELDRFLSRNSSLDTPPVALIVRPDSPDEANQFYASEVAQRLGRAAAALIRRLKINTVVLVGGDTAFETFRALAVREVSIAGELMPGIAIGTICVHGQPMTLVTKAGGFGSADTLVEILHHVRDAWSAGKRP